MPFESLSGAFAELGLGAAGLALEGVFLLTFLAAAFFRAGRFVALAGLLLASAAFSVDAGAADALLLPFFTAFDSLALSTGFESGFFASADFESVVFAAACFD